MSNPILTPSISALVSEVLRAAARFKVIAAQEERVPAALRLGATALRRAAEELEGALLSANKEERKFLHGPETKD